MSKSRKNNIDKKVLALINGSEEPKTTINSLMLGQDLGGLVENLSFANNPDAKLVVLCISDSELEIVHSDDMSKYEVIGSLWAAIEQVGD